jgi:type I restriction enzyme S subunit
MGKTPSRDNPTYWGDDNMWVSIADMNEQKYMSATKEGITDVAVQESGIKPIPKGTVIMSFKLSIGKVSIATSKLYTNEAIMGFIEKEEGTLVPEYLYYYLKGYKWEGANKAAMGMTLNKKTIAENTISYPPVAEQEKIVAELDCLSGIIEKKKQQLKELDNLAQSIFYEMFGDPVENDKGWDVKKFGDVANSELGKMLDSKKNQGKLYPYLCSANVQWNDVDCTQVKEMRFEEDELERYRVYKGDLLICEGGDTGRCAIWKSDNAIYYQNALHRVRFVDGLMLPIFCLYTMKCYKERGEIDKYSSGQTIKHLVKKVLLTIPLIVPPITLQQEFASKIESIEKQKELIAQSIKETETLFNSRMDYYFN